jgi:hypothetical protein
MEDPIRDSQHTDEAFSDVEEGEDPYYPETERVHTTTTRSGRMVYTPQRLVVDPYVDDGSDEPDSMAVETSDSECDSGCDPEESEGDYVAGETEDDDEDAPSSSSGDDSDDDDEDQ